MTESTRSTAKLVAEARGARATRGAEVSRQDGSGQGAARLPTEPDGNRAGTLDLHSLLLGGWTRVRARATATARCAADSTRRWRGSCSKRTSRQSAASPPERWRRSTTATSARPRGLRWRRGDCARKSPAAGRRRRSRSWRGSAGKDVAAISAQPPQMGGMPPFWMSYVSVEDADAATAKARELDANLISEPFDVFDSGRMAVIQDPQGAVFAVRQPKQHIGASLVNAPGAFIWNQGSFPDPEAAKRFYGDLFGWTFVESSEFEGPNAASETPTRRTAASPACRLPRSLRTRA